MIRFIVVKGKRFRFILIFLLAVIMFYVALAIPPSRQVFGRLYQSLEDKLKKENARLEEVLESILPKEDEKLYEPVGRTIDEVPDVKAEPTDRAISEGVPINFEILKDEPGYRRVIYTPVWKDTFYRGWLYLPHKITQARHRLFIYPIGGSANYDFAGELGFRKNIPLDNHRNINLLIFDFKVQEIKRYCNQLILVGKPVRSGFQIVSVVQNDILNPDEKESDFLVQLVTGTGYEVDYDYAHIMQYDFMMEQIREHTVQSPSLPIVEKTLDALVEDNLKLQKELSYYIPVVENGYEPSNEITAELCKPIPPSFPLEEAAVRDMRIKGRELAMKILFEDSEYRRPVYDPAWKEHYRKYWAYVPSQICLNFGRLYVLPDAPDDLKKLLGMLSFDKSNHLPGKNETGFLIYGFNVDHCILYNHQLLFVGEPQRSGVTYITLDNEDLKGYTNYVVRLITLDNEEIDHAIAAGSI